MKLLQLLNKYLIGLNCFFLYSVIFCFELETDLNWDIRDFEGRALKLYFKIVYEFLSLDLKGRNILISLLVFVNYSKSITINVVTNDKKQREFKNN